MHTIGKLAENAGVGVETLRFYQRKGLLGIPEATGKVRQYGSTHLRRVTFIKSAQAAGFTLGEIKQLLAMDASHNHSQARQLALQRLAAIDEQLTQLQVARGVLEKLAHDCEHSRDQPCPIIASFVNAAPVAD
ncbi:MAG: MerR family transcriptional regulator [Halomonadaceae bacterium]|nr:MAG: MerR family transcriptional regulator [Halomonadaceae bacterium]